MTEPKLGFDLATPLDAGISIQEILNRGWIPKAFVPGRTFGFGRVMKIIGKHKKKTKSEVVMDARVQ